MGNTFMTATTQIGDLVRKKAQIIEKTAGLLSEAVADRIRSGNLTKATEKDILNTLDGFSDAEKVEILAKTIVLVGHGSGNARRSRDTDEDDGTNLGEMGYRRPSSDNKGDRSSIFKGRW